MIKLKNITIENNIAKCDIVPEDSLESGIIEIDLAQSSIMSAVLPKGYEWCKMHLEHGKNYLCELYKSKLEVPQEKIIMWY